jgi:hypothetical protein
VLEVYVPVDDITLSLSQSLAGAVTPALMPAKPAIPPTFTGSLNDEGGPPAFPLRLADEPPAPPLAPTVDVEPSGRLKVESKFWAEDLRRILGLLVTESVAGMSSRARRYTFTVPILICRTRWGSTRVETSNAQGSS